MKKQSQSPAHKSVCVVEMPVNLFSNHVNIWNYVTHITVERKC